MRAFNQTEWEARQSSFQDSKQVLVVPVSKMTWSLLASQCYYPRVVGREDDEEDRHPPYHLCILEEEQTLLSAMGKVGRASAAIGLDPLLLEAIRLSLRRIPSIPDDLCQIKALQVDFPPPTTSSYPAFLLVQSNSILVNISQMPRLSQRFYYAPGDWSAIGRMKKLTRLQINHLLMDHFDFLGQCRNLRTLDLFDTNFSDAEPLRPLQNLETLCVARSGFSDCRVLLQLPKLKHVNLRGCSLQHTEVLERLSAKVDL